MKPYSGITIDGVGPCLGSLSPGQYSQKFRLPTNYTRGAEEKHIANLTGFQILVETEEDEVQVEWSLQHTFNKTNEVQEISINTLSSGTYQLSFLGQTTDPIDYDVTGAVLQEKLEALSTIEGNVSVDGRKVTFVGILGETNVEMLQVTSISGSTLKGEWVSSESYSTDDVVSKNGINYIALQSSTDEDPSLAGSSYWAPTVSVSEAIPAYEWKTVAGGDEMVQVLSKNGKAWVDVEFNVEANSLWLDENWRFNFQISGAQICYSAYENRTKGSLENIAELPIVASNQKVSSVYRLLSATLDNGIDFLGNSFRGGVKPYLPESISKPSNAIWMSKPNPSKFAVESLYFDVQKDGKESVVNKVLIDPVTPGIYCNVYYSVENKSENQSYDDLLWRPVLTNLRLSARYNFNFPTPVVAKYIKLEFTQLQARHYIVTNNQPKIEYQKHPKWVLDYFYGIYLEQKEQEIASDVVTVRYNAFDLYYNYFVDDIIESTTLPRSVDRTIDTNILNDYLSNIAREDTELIDRTTMNQISATGIDYGAHPISSVPSRGKNLLRQYNFPNYDEDYSTEAVTTAIADTDLVTSDDRASVQMDREFPVMSFYLPSRHYYRISKAKFENDKAYFAGIKHVAFQRDYYASVSDEWSYAETAGDETNIETNELQFEDGAWTGKGQG